jgi:hypothetical protein
VSVTVCVVMRARMCVRPCACGLAHAQGRIAWVSCGQQASLLSRSLFHIQCVPRDPPSPSARSRSACSVRYLFHVCMVCCPFPSPGTLVVLLTMSAAPIPAWIVSRFRSEIRYTAVAISYNFAQAIFGGTTPLISTALLSVTMGNCTQDGITVSRRRRHRRRRPVVMSPAVVCQPSQRRPIFTQPRQASSDMRHAHREPSRACVLGAVGEIANTC